MLKCLLSVCSPLVTVLMDDSFLLWEEISCLGLILSHVFTFFLTMKFCSYASILATADSLVQVNSLLPPWEINTMTTTQFNLLFHCILGYRRSIYLVLCTEKQQLQEQTAQKGSE